MSDHAKIYTFPVPYEDELLYSVLARYHQRSGGNDVKDTLVELFGARSASAIYDFPCRLQSLCERIPQSLNLSPDKIINELTLLPYYRPFLPSERYEEIKKRMTLDGFGGTYHTMLGAITSGNLMLSNLRYCPACVEADRIKTGEAFWHRSHQLPGINVCHLHQMQLVQSRVQVHSRLNKHNLFSLESVVDLDIANPTSEEVDKTNVWLAKAAYSLLNGKFLPIGPSALKGRYLDVLISRGFASPLGRLRRVEIISGFKAYYGDNCLAKLKCEINSNSEHNWLFALIQRREKVSMPLRHLLIMNFLGVEPADFLSDHFKETKPFGDVPYPCLNPACGHYRKMVIHDVKITRNTCNGRPVGNFICDCGFGYARTGPDSFPEDKFKRTRIIQFGPVWEQELLRLESDPSVSLRQKARWLGVDTNTISKHLERMKGEDEKVSCSAVINDENKIIEYRALILMTIKEHPALGRSKIRELVNKEYTYLYRKDRDWLDANLPQPSRRRTGVSTVDWVKRDAEWSQKIEQIALGILDDKKNIKQITIGRIGEAFGALTTIRNNQQKLPKTKSIISKYVESTEEYQIRRVQIRCEQLLAKGKNLKEWEITRVSGLRPNISSNVRSEIRAQLSK